MQVQAALDVERARQARATNEERQGDTGLLGAFADVGERYGYEPKTIEAWYYKWMALLLGVERSIVFGTERPRS